MNELEFQQFSAIMFHNYTTREVLTASHKQVDAYISDAVDSLVNYVRSVGDAQIDGGWNFS